MIPDPSERPEVTPAPPESLLQERKQREHDLWRRIEQIAARLSSNLENDPRLASGALGSRETARPDVLRASSLAVPLPDASSRAAAPPPEETEDPVVGSTPDLDDKPLAPRSSLAKLDDLLARLQQEDTESSTDAGEASLPETAPDRPLPDNLSEVEQLLQQLENQPRDLPRHPARPEAGRPAAVPRWVGLILMAALELILLYILIYIYMAIT